MWPGLWSWRAQSHCRGPCSGGGRQPRRRWRRLQWSQAARQGQRAGAEWDNYLNLDRISPYQYWYYQQGFLWCKKSAQEWESMTTLRAVEKVTHHPPYGGLLILVLDDPPVHPRKRTTRGSQGTFVPWSIFRALSDPWPNFILTRLSSFCNRPSFLRAQQQRPDSTKTVQRPSICS